MAGSAQLNKINRRTIIIISLQILAHAVPFTPPLDDVAALQGALGNRLLFFGTLKALPGIGLLPGQVLLSCQRGTGKAVGGWDTTMVWQKELSHSSKRRETKQRSILTILLNLQNRANVQLGTLLGGR